MVQQLPGLIRQSGLGVGSKGSRSGVGDRVQVDTRQNSVPIRPQAGPVDIFEGLASTPTAAQTEAGQIASALLQLAPSVGRLGAALGRGPSQDDKIASTNAAELIPMEQVRASIEQKHSAPSVADPKSYFGVMGRRAGQDFMQQIEAGYNPAEHGTKEQYIEQQTQSRLEQIRELYGDTPEGNMLIDGFIRAVNPDRFRIAQQEAQRDIVQNREDYKNSVGSHLLNTLATARAPGNDIKPETLRAIIDGWVKEIPKNADLAGTTKTDIAKALGQAAAHFANQGDLEMVKMIGETQLSGAAGTIKTHPEFIAVFDKAKAVGVAKNQDNVDKSTFRFRQDIIESARRGDLSKSQLDKLREEAPSIPDAFWTRASNLSITARTGAANDAAIAERKAAIQAGAVEAAQNGTLAQYTAKFEGTDDAKHLKGIEGRVRNLIEDIYKDEPQKLLETKLQYYAANPTATGKDPTWDALIQQALTNMDVVKEGQALPEQVTSGLQLFEMIDNHSSWLADKYVSNEDQKLLKAAVALNAAGSSPAEISTWITKAKDGLAKGIQSQIDIRSTDFKKVIKDDLDNLDVEVPGFFFGTNSQELGNQQQIENRVFQMADVLAIGGMSHDRAIALAWDRVKKSHTLVDGVLVPSAAKQLPPNLPVVLESVTQFMWDAKAEDGESSIKDWVEAQDDDADVDSLYWAPRKDDNINEWQLFMWQEMGDKKVPIPVAGVTMSIAQMGKLANKAGQKMTEEEYTRIIDRARKNSSGAFDYTMRFEDFKDERHFGTGIPDVGADR